MSQIDRTKDRLARELRIVAEKASPANAAKYEALAVRAGTGEFDDFGSVHACGLTVLHGELLDAGFTKFAARVASGEFDATMAESNEWAASKEAGEIFGTLPDDLRIALGDPRMRN